VSIDLPVFGNCLNHDPEDLAFTLSASHRTLGITTVTCMLLIHIGYMACVAWRGIAEN